MLRLFDPKGNLTPEEFKKLDGHLVKKLERNFTGITPDQFKTLTFSDLLTKKVSLHILPSVLDVDVFHVEKKKEKQPCDLPIFPDIPTVELDDDSEVDEEENYLQSLKVIEFPKIDTITSDFVKLLCEFTRAGRLDLVEELMPKLNPSEHKKVIITHDEHKNTAWHYAASHNHLDLLKYFSAMNQEGLFVKNGDGDTPFLVTKRDMQTYGYIKLKLKYCLADDDTCLEALNQLIINVPNFTVLNDDFSQLLFETCRFGDLNLLEQLMKKLTPSDHKQAIVTIHQHFDEPNGTVCHLAAVLDHLELVKYFLQINPEVLFVVDSNNHTPFMVANEGTKTHEYLKLELANTIDDFKRRSCYSYV